MIVFYLQSNESQRRVLKRSLPDTPPVDVSYVPDESVIAERVELEHSYSADLSRCIYRGGFVVVIVVTLIIMAGSGFVKCAFIYLYMYLLCCHGNLELGFTTIAFFDSRGYS